MWLLNDSAQTAETASLNPWNVDMQQCRWGGPECNEGVNYEERMRSIIPPAFRNGNAKIIWQDNNRTLEANVNEALGITGWSTATSGQFADQDIINNGSNQYQSPFSNDAGAACWGQTEIDQQRPWEGLNGMSQPMRNPPGFCANGGQIKGWLNPEEQCWMPAAPTRPPSIPCGPPPAIMNPSVPAWQPNIARGSVYSVPPARFDGPPFDTGMPGAWNHRPAGMPPAVGVPPPQRSRLQSLWTAPPSSNVPPACLTPPNADFNVQNSTRGQWSAPNNGGTVPGNTLKQNFSVPYGNPTTPPISIGVFSNNTGSTNSNSFMGESLMWQDPNGDVRKWQRDTGTAVWGDPEKQPKEILRWLVPPGAEYDGGGDNIAGSKEDTSTKSTSGKGKVIIPSGWGDLPPISLKSPNSTSSGVSSVGSAAPWGNKPLQPPSDSPLNANWDHIKAIKPNSGPWGFTGEHPPQTGVTWNQLVNASSPIVPNHDGGMPIATQIIADQLRNAVAKGFIDFSLLSKPLSQQTLTLINTLLRRLPTLEQSEQQLVNLMASTKNMDVEPGGGIRSPLTLLNPEQRAEHDRLVIEIAATKADIADIREKIHSTNDIINGIKQGPSGLNEVVTTAIPRFGDSLLDVAAGLEQPKPLFF